MAFRATNVVTSEGYNKAKRMAVSIKQYMQNQSAILAAGTNANQVLGLSDSCQHFRDELNDIKTIPGILQYAKDQENDQTYDVAVEFNALIADIEAVITEIVTTIPTDANDWLLVRKQNADGSIVQRDFTPAQLANLKSLVDAVDAAIV